MNNYINFPTLKINDTGEEVKILQEKLKILNYYPSIVTGSFGYNTELGLKLFQQDYNLTPTGIVDNKTWKVLFEQTQINFPSTFQSKPTLRLGDTGEYVEELQNKLKNLFYYSFAITGYFDNNTESAVKTFQYINKLTSDGIVGQNTWSALEYLYSPLAVCAGTDTGTPEEATTYTVKSGDTLYSIAKKFNTTVDELKRLNNLTSNTLSINQVLKVSSTSTPEEETTTYTVKSGDTLYSIAKKFNTTVDELKRLNNLTSNTLSINQVLKISSTSTPEEETTTYTVKSGDTLYSIAKKFNTTVDELKRLNNLTSNTLSINQVLKVSNASTPEEEKITYTVKSGDTLYGIARKFNITVDELKKLNNLTSDILSINQTLKIN